MIKKQTKCVLSIRFLDSTNRSECLYIKRKKDIKYIDLARRTMTVSKGNTLTDFNAELSMSALMGSQVNLLY